MCGIIGYLGSRDCVPVILSGLSKLEYRGYDSAGIAFFEGGNLTIKRAVGKLAALTSLFDGRKETPDASIGIGHTRWATHGKPSENNAHPHTAGRVSLIHNGIIENYAELRAQLKKEGSSFLSETDTEIAAHLLHRNLERGLDPFEALKRTCSEIRGSYAFVAIDAQHRDRLLVAKNATPIVIGIGDREFIVASDIPGVLDYTRQVVILEDGDLCEITRDGIRVENRGEVVTRKPMTVTWDPVTAQKGGYKHFMIKEIHEQPLVLGEAFRGRIDLGTGRVRLEELTMSEEEVRGIRRISMVACGSAWHACLVTKFFIEQLAGIPCDVDYASEFRYRTPLVDDHTLVVAISQSGETADTLAAIERAKERAPTLALCNVLGSSLTRKVKHVVYTQAGPEISVASTKAFTAQLVAGYLLALFLAERRGTLSAEEGKTRVEDLLRLPGAIEAALRCEQVISELSRKVNSARDFLFLGRGVCYPIALEGALKLKEISYIHAEGYPAGEMKHGPIALIDEKVPVVVIMHRSSVLFDKALSNLREVESRGGRIIAIADIAGHEELQSLAEAVVEVPHVSELLSSVLMTIPLQLLAYHVAVANGTDVDLPRNLAKSVTVE